MGRRFPLSPAPGQSDLIPHLLRILTSSPEFAWATVDQRLELVTLGLVREVETTEYLIHEGREGSSFFILISGELEVLQKNQSTHKQMVLARCFNEGDVIGEWAATRTQQIRSASVRAVQRSSVLEISYSLMKQCGGYSDLIHMSSSRGHELSNHDSLMQKSPLFRTLSNQGSSTIASSEKLLANQEIIFTEGDVSTKIYFVLSGSVEIYRGSGSKRELFTRLFNGQLFGELGVIRNKPRSASARAVGDTRLLTLDAKRFLQLSRDNLKLGEYQNSLRKIYRTRSGEMVLQVEDRIDGIPVFVSTIQLDESRQLVTQFGIHETFMKLDMLPAVEAALSFTFVDAGRNIHRRLDVAQGDVIGARLTGPCIESGRIVEAIRNKETLSLEVLERFEQTGLLFEDVIDNSIICHCMQIKRDEIEEAVLDGCQGVDSIMRLTGAGTVCGGCRGDLELACGHEPFSDFKILETLEIAPDTFRIRFTPVTDTPLLFFRPGQHILVEGEIDGTPVSRPYSLTCAGDEDRWREITMQRQPHGLFSRWLSEVDLRQAKIRLSFPRGVFTSNLNGDSTVVMLVAGIGVTPAVSMARTRARISSGTRLIIDHSARTRPQLIYFDELTSISKEFDSIEYHSRLSAAGESLCFDDLARYHSSHPDAHWMICGPEKFEHDLTAWLQQLKVPDLHIAREQFEPTELAASKPITKDRTSSLLTLMTVIFTAIVLWSDSVPVGLKLWQQTTSGHWISGGGLLLFLSSQWIFPFQRALGSGSNSALTLPWHRRLGAMAPLLLLLHGNSVGMGLLTLITVIFLVNSLVGAFDRTFFSDMKFQQVYLKWWLFPHIGLSIILSALALFHIWVILGHGGP